MEISLIDYENILKSTRSYTISVLVGDSENCLLKVQQIRLVYIGRHININEYDSIYGYIYIIILYFHCTFVMMFYIYIFNSNEEFLKQRGIINMTVTLKKKKYLDIPDYTVTVCLISDQWGTYYIYYNTITLY